MRQKVIILVMLLGAALLSLSLLVRQRTKPQPVATHSERSRTEVALTANDAMEELEMPSEPDITEDPAIPPSLVSVLDRNLDIWARYERARSLSRTLNQREIAAVVTFLKDKHEEDSSPLAHALKNDLMDVLCAQDRLPPTIAQVFGAIYDDRSQDPVLRDYALQHLATLYERVFERTGFKEEGAQGRKKRIEACLWDAVENGEPGLAGTALTGLARLERVTGHVDRARLGSSALRIAGDTRAEEQNRISALQVCGQLGVQESLPIILETVERGQTLMLQLSAIGAAGRIGGKEEMELLQEVSAHGSERLKFAAMTAIRKIQERTSQL